MSQPWKSQEGVKMDSATAAAAAKITCARNPSASMAMESEDAPEDLQATADEGLDTMTKIFVW